jgi:hypothetical protein
VGLALSTRSGRKLLGQDEIAELGVVKRVAPISPGDTITGFILHISDIMLNPEPYAERIAKSSEKRDKSWAMRTLNPSSEEHASLYEEVGPMDTERMALDKKLRSMRRGAFLMPLDRKVRSRRRRASLKALTVCSSYVLPLFT